MTLSPEVLYSYSLCQQLGTVRLVTDGKREERLPVCDDHWDRLHGPTGQPEFSIDSASPGDPVIEPHWIGRF